MKKTIFFGNGINWDSKDGVSWEQLLVGLANEHKVKYKSVLKKKLYTLLYEQVVMKIDSENVLISEEIVKNKLAAGMIAASIPDIYELMFELEADVYITTNYENHLLKTFEHKGFRFRTDEKQEKIFSIRRKYIIEDSKLNSKCTIWNIHGSVNNPKTIMLGLDHYCSYTAKIDSYLKGKYKIIDDKFTEKMEEKISDLTGCKYDGISWIEHFFNSDVYIVGFGMSYSETDIWWILNKRARMKQDKKLSSYITNKIVYYGEVDSAKFELLKSLDVEVIRKKTKESWEPFNKLTFEDIKKRIKDF